MFRNRQETIAPSESSVKASVKRDELAELGKIEEQYRNNIKELSVELDSLICEKERRELLLTKLEDVNNKLFLAEKELDRLINGIKNASNEKKLLSESVTELRKEKDELDNFIKDNIGNKAELSELKEDINAQALLLEDAKKEKEELEKKILKLNQAFIATKRNIEEETVSAQEKLGSLSLSLQKDIDKLLSEKSKLSAEIGDIKQKINILSQEAGAIIINANNEADKIILTAQAVASEKQIEQDKRDGDMSIREKFLDSRATLLRSAKEQLENKLGKKIDIIEF